MWDNDTFGGVSLYLYLDNIGQDQGEDVDQDQVQGKDKDHGKEVFVTKIPSTIVKWLPAGGFPWIWLN